MKNILLTIGLLIALSSCEKRGEIIQEPIDFIEIHGKIYKLVNIVPCYGCRGIWIMYPKDSLDSQPKVINYNELHGKTTVNQTVIKID